MLSVDKVANTTDRFMVPWKYSLGQGLWNGQRSFIGPWEGPARGAKCRSERRSDARGRGLWADGSERVRNGSSLCFVFAGSAAQAVTLEFDTVSIVNDAVQYGVGEGWVCDNVMPLEHGHLACDQQ